MSKPPEASLTLPGELEKAIHDIRSKGLAVTKTGKVGNKFDFMSYADVWETLLPETKAAGLSVGFEDSSIRVEQDREILGIHMVVSNGAQRCRTHWEVMFPESIKNSGGSAVTNSSQRTGGAQSYLKRIALKEFFNIATGTEDEVERMTPRAGETNIPGLVTVAPDAHWSTLMNGAWRDVMSPRQNGKLESETEQGMAHMGELWKAYPQDKGLMAFWADWAMNKMEDKGLAWRDVLAARPELPESLDACSSRDELATACAYLREVGK